MTLSNTEGAADSGPIHNGSNALRAAIASAQIAASLVRSRSPVPSVECAARAFGVVPGAIVKSILFERKHDASLVCLAVVPGDCRVSRAKVSEALGMRQLRLASAQTVVTATGYHVGGVPPVAHRQRILVVIDRCVFAREVVFGGGGDEWHMLRIAPQEIQRVTNAVIADVIHRPDDRGDV